MPRIEDHAGRRERTARKLAVLVLCAALVLSAALAPGAAAQGAAAARVESMRLQEAAGAVELTLVSTTELGLVGVRAEADGALVLQLPRHVPGDGVGDVFPPTGLVEAVALSTEQTSRGPLTRLRIAVRQPVSHTMSSHGSVLRLRLWPRGAEPREAALGREVAELRTSLAASERARRELAERLDSVTAENRELARHLAGVESRRSDLDASLKATLAEVTGVLGELSGRVDELSDELRRAESREGELHARVAELEASLAGSAAERAELASRLDAAVAERDELARGVRELAERERQLESALAERAERIAQLEAEGSAVAAELEQRLDRAAGREEELRAQLAALDAALAELTPTVRLEAAAAETGPAALVGVPELVVEPAEPAGGEPSRRRRGWAREAVNLRTGPGTEFGRRAVLPPGAEVELLDRRESWLRVRSGAAGEGWVYGELMRLEEGFAVELRAALAAARSELGLLREAAASPLAEQETSRLNGRLDALAAACGDLAADLETSRAELARLREAGTVRARTTEWVNLRRGAGMSHGRRRVLEAGTALEVLGRDGSWVQVRAAGEEGWVYGDYVRLEADELAAVAAELAAVRAEAARLRSDL